ncbi:MAG: hypothetical protein ACYC6Y_30805 [Thermoguttaceae bacterium]
MNLSHQYVLAQTVVASLKFGDSYISEPDLMTSVLATKHVDFTPTQWAFTIVEDLDRDTIVELIGFRAHLGDLLLRRLAGYAAIASLDRLECQIPVPKLIRIIQLDVTLVVVTSFVRHKIFEKLL